MFDYDKLKKKAEGSNEWSSYADLFMVLSLVFLLLYVTANLREGTFSIQKNSEYQRLADEAADLREQIKVYNTLKDEHLSKNATDGERKVYEQLMSKLSLLQEDAKKEKEELRKQAQDNEAKEMALNKYQQVIRNIINANVLAKTRIERKDTVISKKKKQIDQLKTSLAEKRRQIQEGKQSIKDLNTQLDRKIKQLRSSYKRQKITKKKMNRQIAKFRKQTHARVKKLERQNQEVSSQLQQASSQLQEAEETIASKEKTIQAQEQEKQKLSARLESQKQEYMLEISEIKSEYNKRVAKEKEAFDWTLKQQKISAKAKAAKEAEFRQRMQEEKEQLNQQVAALQDKMGETEKELKKARALANARKNLARRIQQNFARAGVKASVNANTGDVELTFGDEYFDTGKSKLKPRMESTLQEFMPVYSSSLFKDPAIARKIQSVEIVGFASPTYQGKYIDPKSLDPNDRQAVDYNLDLSYNRAKSIFSYIFDTGKMQYQNQKRLLPLVKVTGRSFLAEGSKGRGLASGINRRDYCKKFDCKKSQKVIIRFNLDD